MSDSTWYPRDSEAESLAAQLRSQRLTLLFGETGSGKTTLLTAGVLPLLHRRASDDFGVVPPADSASAVVLPFPERRGAEGDDIAIDGPQAVPAAGGEPASRRDDDAVAPVSIGPDGEVAVFYDVWDEAPLDGLLDRLRDALNFPHFDGIQRRRSLASTLGSFHRQRGGKSLIVFDRFEELLIKPESAPGVRQFADAFVDAMNRPGLPVHFLVSIDEAAAPLLERFRGRIAGLDDHCMRLPPLKRPAEGPPQIPVLRQVPDGYRPPIDLELPSQSPPPAIQPTGAYLDATGRLHQPDTHRDQPLPPPEFVTSRQPEWLDSAFASPGAGQMNTQDVYASMESLLGKIVQGSKEGESRAPHQPELDDSLPAAPPVEASMADEIAEDLRPEPKPKPKLQQRPDPWPRPEAQRRAAAASNHAPTQVWPPSTVARQPEAAPEFAPLFTFEAAEHAREASEASPSELTQARDTADLADSAATAISQPARDLVDTSHLDLPPRRARPRAAAAAATEPSHGLSMTGVGEAIAARAATRRPSERPPAADSVQGEVPGRDEAASSPHGADWLSEVHASLTKLSNQHDENEEATAGALPAEEAYLGGYAETAAPRRERSGWAKAVAIVAILALVVILAAAGATFLPPEYRPFELPASIGSLVDSINAPAPPSTYEAPAAPAR